ncbi:MAG: GNAT family N-acetyltransferase [Firmicutes bacterium]|nr:GNAT family N-acetyltransferase [Bacillota bacterium]
MIGEKIFIRESNFDDCKYFARWESDPKVTEFFTIDDGKNYEDTVKEFFKRMEDYTKRQFTVCLTETGEPIGRVYISNINSNYDSLDITRIYIADPSVRGKGYGEEMLRLLLKWAFVDMGCERVTLDHFTGNIIARKLYEKIGFVREGVMRHSGKKNGKYVDLCLMSILRDEYFK